MIVFSCDQNQAKIPLDVCQGPDDLMFSISLQKKALPNFNSLSSQSDLRPGLFPI